MSWEQKGKSEKVPVYEAEVCFGTAGLESADEDRPCCSKSAMFSAQKSLCIPNSCEDWKPVRSLYVQQMEDTEGETGGLRSVTAPRISEFVHKKLDPLGSPAMECPGQSLHPGIWKCRRFVLTQPTFVSKIGPQTNAVSESTRSTSKPMVQQTANMNKPMVQWFNQWVQLAQCGYDSVRRQWHLPKIRRTKRGDSVCGLKACFGQKFGCFDLETISGGDWSTPTAWQEPGVMDGELPLPGQPTVRILRILKGPDANGPFEIETGKPISYFSARSNMFTFALQWEVSGNWSLLQNLQYEVQAGTAVPPSNRAMPRF